MVQSNSFYNKQEIFILPRNGKPHINKYLSKIPTLLLFFLTWAWTSSLNIKIKSGTLLEGTLSSFHVNKKPKDRI